MVAVPVLAPRRQLKWAKPPNVLAGIDAFRKARFQMQKTVHEGLHMKTVTKSETADPKETSPTEEEIAETD